MSQRACWRNFLREARTVDGSAKLARALQSRPLTGSIGWPRMAAVAAFPFVPMGIIEACTALAGTCQVVTAVIGTGAMVGGAVCTPWALGVAKRDLTAYRVHINTPIDDGIEQASTSMGDWEQFVSTLSAKDVDLYKSRLQTAYTVPTPLLFLEEYMISSVIMGTIGGVYVFGTVAGMSGVVPMLAGFVISGGGGLAVAVRAGDDLRTAFYGPRYARVLDVLDKRSAALNQ